MNFTFLNLALSNFDINGVLGHASRRQGSGLASAINATSKTAAQQRSFSLRQGTTQQVDYSSGVEGLDPCVEISRRERTELLNTADERTDDERIRSSYRSTGGKLFYCSFLNINPKHLLVFLSLSNLDLYAKEKYRTYFSPLVLEI